VRACSHQGCLESSIRFNRVLRFLKEREVYP